MPVCFTNSVATDLNHIHTQPTFQNLFPIPKKKKKNIFLVSALSQGGVGAHERLHLLQVLDPLRHQVHTRGNLDRGRGGRDKAFLLPPLPTQAAHGVVLGGARAGDVRAGAARLAAVNEVPVDDPTAVAAQAQVNVAKGALGALVVCGGEERVGGWVGR